MRLSDSLCGICHTTNMAQGNPNRLILGGASQNAAQVGLRCGLPEWNDVGHDRASSLGLDVLKAIRRLIASALLGAAKD